MLNRRGARGRRRSGIGRFHQPADAGPFAWTRGCAAQPGVRRRPPFSHAVGGAAGCAGPGSRTARRSPHQRRKNATSVVMSFAIQERPGRMDEKRRTAPYSKTHNGGRHDDLDLEYGATTVLVAGRTTFEQRPTFPAHERRSLPATNNLPVILYGWSRIRTLWVRGVRRTSFQTCPTFGHPLCS